jgi:hypothetical protein
LPSGYSFVAHGDGDYATTRLRFGMGITPFSWLTFYGEAQDSHVLGYAGTAPSSMYDPLDLRQAYVQLGTPEGNGASLKFGRQEVQFGAGRLISVGDWSNITKTFDVAHGVVQEGALRADIIAGSVVAINPNGFDEHKPGEHIYGSYFTWSRPVKSVASIEPYFFTKTLVSAVGERGGAGNSDEYVSGVRAAGVLPNKTTWSVEGVREWGFYATDHIAASGLTASVATSLHLPWKARVLADYNYASGDRSATDGTRGTFDFLYGLNQPFFSVTGMVGWKNLVEPRTGIEITPIRRVTFTVDYRDVGLATVSDGLYNSAGTRIVLNRKATSSHVGNSIEAQGLWTVTPKTTIGIGLGDLMAGEFLRQSGKASGYIYPYLSFKRTL